MKVYDTHENKPVCLNHLFTVRDIFANLLFVKELQVSLKGPACRLVNTTAFCLS